MVSPKSRVHGIVTQAFGPGATIAPHSSGISKIQTEKGPVHVPTKNLRFVARNWSSLADETGWDKASTRHTMDGYGLSRGYYTRDVAGRQLFMKKPAVETASELGNMLMLEKGVTATKNPKITIRAPSPILADSNRLVMERVSGLQSVPDYMESHPEHAEAIERLANTAAMHLYKTYQLPVETGNTPGAPQLHVESFDPATGKVRFVVTDLKHRPI